MARILPLTMGGIDGLVNNAGDAYRGEIGALDVAKMKEMFASRPVCRR